MLSMVMAIPLTFVHLIKKSYRDAERSKTEA
jgi:hypothetical protein